MKLKGNEKLVLSLEEIDKIVERMKSSFESRLCYAPDKKELVESIRGDIFCSTDLEVIGTPSSVLVSFHAAKLLEKERPRFIVVFPGGGSEEGFYNILATVEAIVEKVKASMMK